VGHGSPEMVVLPYAEEGQKVLLRLRLGRDEARCDAADIAKCRNFCKARGADLCPPMPTDIARYSIELFKQGGEGIEQVLGRHGDIQAARSIYRISVEQYPGRLIMLCDGAQVLARSDRPNATR
jgi:hypothetical protein